MENGNDIQVTADGCPRDGGGSGDGPGNPIDRGGDHEPCGSRSERSILRVLLGIATEVIRRPPVDALLTSVRSGRHACYDRMVMDVQGPVGGYKVNYVEGTPAPGNPNGLYARGGAESGRLHQQSNRAPAVGAVRHHRRSEL